MKAFISFLVLSFTTTIFAQLYQPGIEARLDPFSTPNVHVDLGYWEKGALEYYGSGDVNNDGVIGYFDLNAMEEGVLNDMADVDGDSTGSSEIDRQILQDYLEGNIDFLPGQWNHLKPSEKISWVEKMIEIDPTDENPYVPYPEENFYDCGWFAKEMLVNNFGVDNFGNYAYYDKLLQHGDENARFNIPVYVVNTKSYPEGDDPPVGHFINAVLVGDPNESDERYSEDPTNFNHWYFFEPQTDERVFPGDFSMNPNEDVKIQWFGYYPAGEGFTTSEILYFHLNDGEAGEPYYVNANLLTSNPNDPTEVRDGKLATEFKLGNAYPNPVNGIINIPYHKKETEQITFEIYDILGRQLDVVNITETATSNIFTYNLSNFSSGAYFIMARTSQGNYQVVKVVNMK
ncbi:MAG: T9SS type A sorting domain-containing protein [Melioribacteraceae bacterium]|nr:T9SS type A sorting domain-containing protein [Melioribacteraceae bacterium]MCF8356433.1 T9SS type A sorting domain-containing protein [Melioribacteraceae bacterium]MCF8394874.1 T9SS type A sorting domain-containing protein [Melioribacteraceae bacterium]